MAEGDKAGLDPEQGEGWAPIKTISKNFIKNILHSHIFPGHSSSLMTLV